MKQLNHLKAIVLTAIGFILIFPGTKAFSQNDDDAVNLKFYGFIRNEAYFDTYKGVDAAMDQFYLVPLYTGKDDNGEHFNQQGSAHITAIATRLGANITGPEILGAKPLGNFEFDFAGITTKEPVLIRIRKAFLKLQWEKSALLVGQNWHPFWGGACFPTVAGLNTGAPFQPFNRSPQINFDYTISNIQLSATMLYENQYVSKGFYSVTNSNNATLPKRNAAIPEMVFGAKYQSDNLVAGVAGQYNAILPIDRTSGTQGTYVSKQLNTSTAAMAYVQYKTPKLKILAKSIYGQNLAHLSMLGGYGVHSVDEATGAHTYTNYTHYTAMLNIVYGKTHQVGMFAATGKNMGTNASIVSKELTAGTLTGIQDLYRVSLHYAYNVKNFRFVGEWEHTAAAYGTGDINVSNGLYNTAEQVANNRLIFVMMYMF